MQKKHVFILLIIALLCNGCGIHKKKIDESVKKILEDEKYAVQDVKIAQKSFVLSPIWMTKCSVMFSDEVDCSTELKSIAYSLGISLNFPKDLKVTYQAKKKAFIDILLDISDQLNLIITIKGENANISEDISYLHNYSLENLASSVNTEFSTSVDNSFGDNSKNNISKNSYQNNNDYYKMISQNLGIILPKPCVFTINPSAGVITVIATQKYQKKVSRYLHSIRRKMNNQILVEAKLLEVELFSDYSYGVDLDALKDYLLNNFSIVLPENSVTNLTTGNILRFTSKVADTILKQNILNYLSICGNTTSVSNPYLLLSNGHIGLFKAVENKVFFQFKNETILGADNKLGRNNKHSEMITYQVGSTLSIHGVILNNDLIKLYIKPTVTHVSKEVEDAGYKFINDSKSASNQKIPTVPIIKIREMESVLILRDGEYAIIGGFMDEITKNEEKSFKSSKNIKKTELIILLKVKIVKNEEQEDNYDFLVES